AVSQTATVQVNAGPASKLALTTQPSSTAQSGVALAPQPVVQIQDANGNAVSDGGATVTATVTPAGATPSNATATTGTSGAATFSGLTLNGTAGSYTLSFGSGTLTPATATITLTAGSAATNTLTAAASGSGITGNPVTFTVDGTAGTATQMAFTVPPSNTPAGAAISPPVQVTARDQFGNTATQFTGNITLAIPANSNPGGGTLSGTKTVAAVSGVATFSDLSINNAGNGYRLRATSSGLTALSSPQFNITTVTPT